MLLEVARWLFATYPAAALTVAVWAIWFCSLQSWWTALAVLAAAVGAQSIGWGLGGSVDAAAGALVVGYVVDCLLDPRADCWWCHGSSKRRNDRDYFHLCFICGGSGQRKRWGSQVLARHRPEGSDVT